MRRVILVFVSVLGLAALPGCRETLECPADRVACDGRCVSLQVDPDNCGTCGHGCALGQACGRGVCEDAEHCGPEGRACVTGERCAENRCVADLYVACYTTHEVREATRDLEPAGIPLDVARGPISLAELDGEIYVASAESRGVETVSRIVRDPPVDVDVLWNTDSSPPDLEFLAAHDGLLYVSRASQGTLVALDRNGAKLEEHALVAAGVETPNPLGLAFSGDRAYVTLEDRDEVVVLDVASVGRCAAPGSCIREVARIDVSPLASAGAHAMPSRVVVAGGRAYVSLWNMDASFVPPPHSTGRLAAIDLASSTLDASAGPGGLVDLGPDCLNPGEAAVQGTTLYVTCGAMDFSGATPRMYAQGIAVVDLSASPLEVREILPAPSDASPGSIAICSGTGYLADRASGRVFRLDPVAGAVDGTELCPPGDWGAFVADIECGF